MSKLDMNMFAFVAWLGRNQHAHSEDGLTVNDGYEWYNYMWNQWLQNSDVGRKISNGEITTMGGNNNIPDTNTTGNISDNMWTKTLTNDRIMFENDLWNKTVNWDIMNKHTRVRDEEQAPYNVKTNVVTSGKTDDGTLAVIEITIDIKQR
jgi:hypothetical protein